MGGGHTTTTIAMTTSKFEKLAKGKRIDNHCTNNSCRSITAETSLSRPFSNLILELYTKTKELTLLSCISTGAGADAEAAEKRARKCYSQPPKVPTIHTSVI
uniref:Uncharacterized protein n=1 Tax=Glossina palpalis gambiensis TaxID=67801 RepID=A0A1B0APD1_9MUSC